MRYKDIYLLSERVCCSITTFNSMIFAILIFSFVFFPNSSVEAQQISCPLVEQITDAQGASGEGDPSINADGTLIAFESSANINGGNPEFNTEIFLYDTTTSTFTHDLPPYNRTIS